MSQPEGTSWSSAKPGRTIVSFTPTLWIPLGAAGRHIGTPPHLVARAQRDWLSDGRITGPVCRARQAHRGSSSPLSREESDASSADDVTPPYPSFGITYLLFTLRLALSEFGNRSMSVAEHEEDSSNVTKDRCTIARRRRLIASRPGPSRNADHRPLYLFGDGCPRVVARSVHGSLPKNLRQNRGLAGKTTTFGPDTETGSPHRRPNYESAFYSLPACFECS